MNGFSGIRAPKALIIVFLDLLSRIFPLIVIIAAMITITRTRRKIILVGDVLK